MGFSSSVSGSMFYEKFDNKIGMNENIDIGSSIEENLLYKMADFVFPPKSISKGAVVNKLF